MIKAAIVGFGDGGRWNFLALRSLGVKIVGIVDSIPKEVDTPFFSNLDKLFLGAESFDLLVIASPDAFHLAQTEEALKKGVPFIFVEKPLTVDKKELRRFCELASHFPRRIIFGEKYSYANPVQMALAKADKLGNLVCGETTYTMSNCDRIMVPDSWRLSSAYNPCAGGLSHNFMTLRLFAKSPINKVWAIGQVLTYDNLRRIGGYDTMMGVIEFLNGICLQWQVCLGIKGDNSPYGHRTVAHNLQFERGTFVYAPDPKGDKLIVGGKKIDFMPEPEKEEWHEYNKELYIAMHRDTLSCIRGGRGIHDIQHGINVAAACIYAFDSANEGGAWKEVPEYFF